MTLDLACAECEASFELDVTELLDEPGRITCPNCEAKAPRRKAEVFASAVDELLRAVAGLAEKFSVTLSAETDDLPAAYETGRRTARRAVAEEEEDDEDEDEAEEDESYDEEIPEDESDD